jgi:hypothetical protein
MMKLKRHELKKKKKKQTQTNLQNLGEFFKSVTCEILDLDLIKKLNPQ